MMWIPVVAPTATSGTVLNFTGPYPQTIDLQGNYTLNPSSHPIDNLNIGVIVQGYQSNDVKEVFNAYFNPLVYTGIEDSGSASIDGGATLTAWPNPSSGPFSVSSYVPQGITGTVEIFDVSGRSVERFQAGSLLNMTLEEPGIYFLRLTTDQGEVINQQMTVIR